MGHFSQYIIFNNTYQNPNFKKAECQILLLGRWSRHIFDDSNHSIWWKILDITYKTNIRWLKFGEWKEDQLGSLESRGEKRRDFPGFSLWLITPTWMWNTQSLDISVSTVLKVPKNAALSAKRPEKGASSKKESLIQ